MSINPEGRESRKTERLKVFLILFTSFLTLIAASAVSVGYSVHRYWESVLRQEITRNLTQKSQMFANRISTDRAHKIEDITSQEGQNAGARATVIDSSGRVVADSEIAVASLENEGRRPEFVTASRGQVGVETRKRNAFGVPMLYVAVPFAGGSARLAYPLADIEIATARARRILLIGSLVATLAALAISSLAAGTVTRRPST
jgi:two-component system, OmpR family, phosphate regulon sensor histidine kinase PhoR